MLWKPALAVLAGAAAAFLLQDWHWLIVLMITAALIAVVAAGKGSSLPGRGWTCGHRLSREKVIDPRRG
jgi:hypothetical protein